MPSTASRDRGGCARPGVASAAPDRAGGPAAAGVGGGQREQRDPGLEPVLGAEPGEAHLHEPVAVEAGDGAAQPAAVAEVDVDVDGRRPRCPWVTRLERRSATGGASSTIFWASRQPSWPGGQHAAPPLRRRACSRVEPAEQVAQHPVADLPLRAGRRARPAGRRRGSLVLVGQRAASSRRRRNSLDRVLEERRPGRRARRRPAAAGGSGPGEEPAGATRGRPTRPGTRRAPTRSKENGAGRRAAARLRASKGCSGCRTQRRGASPPVAVASTASSSSPSGTAGGRGWPVRLVGAGVGDDQVLGRGTSSRRAAAGGPRCAGRARRRRGRRASTSSPSSTPARGNDAVVEAEQADHPVRDRAHRHHRRDGEGAGAEVGPGRAARRAARAAAPRTSGSRSVQRRVPAAASRDVGELARGPGRSATRRRGRYAGQLRRRRPRGASSQCGERAVAGQARR